MTGTPTSIPGTPGGSDAENRDTTRPLGVSINLGDAAFPVSTTGLVVGEELTTEMGAFRRTYPVKTLTGTGSSLTFAISVPAAAASLILEIQEIHHRRERAFAYTVAIDGRDCYFRTYAEIGGGPNHWFMALPESTAGASQVIVSITSAGASPFSLARVWLYGDFFTTIDVQEQVYRPLMLMGKFDKAAAAEPAMRSFGPFGTFFKNDYAKLPAAMTQRNLRDLLTESGTTQQPFQFLWNGPTWGGALSGPDGRGGYFNDVRYSVLSYDPAHDLFVPSFPNMWGSTFWATFRDPWLNQVLARRFVDGLQGHTRVIEELKIKGLDPQPYFVREMGPPLGEVTAATRAAAAAEGINLDPRAGLDARARLWLYRDAVRLWQEIAASHAAAIPRDSVVVDRGTLRLPTSQLSEEQYSHTVFKSEAPMQNARWFGGQTGMVPGFWTTGELFWDRFDAYDYVKANGKLVHGNLEATILKNDCRPLRLLYASGFQYVCFLNDGPDFTACIRRADGCDEMPALPAIDHERVVFAVPIGLQGTFGRDDQVLDHDNLDLLRQSRENADVTTTAKLLVNDLNRPGRITWRVSDGGEPFTAGLRLRLEGRIAPGAGNAVEIWTGTTITTLQCYRVLSAADLPCPDHWTPFMTSTCEIDLGSQMIGTTQLIIRLKMTAEQASDGAFLIDAQVTSQWPRTSGSLMASTWNMRQQRTLELWVQDRAVAQHLIDRYTSLSGDPVVLSHAQTLADGLRYRSVQRLLLGALSEILPARYVIRGHGQLGRYRLHVTLPTPEDIVVIVLESISDTECTFTVDGKAPRQQLAVAFGTTSTAPFQVTRREPHHFQLGIGSDPEGPRAVDGWVTATIWVTQQEPPAKQLPATLVARYLGGDRQRIRVDTQDLALMDFQDALELDVAPDASCRRRPERMSLPGTDDWPQMWDEVTLSLDPHGRVTDIRAVYGADRGRIEKVIPPSPMGVFTNGAVVLDNGHEYEFSYETTLDTIAMHGRFCAYETRMIARGLQPGEELLLLYSPYTECGTTRRLISLHQSQTVLLDEDYLAMPAATWTRNATACKGLRLGPHIPEPNYLHDISLQLLRPSAPFVEGWVSYHVRGNGPLGMTVVEFAARAFEDSSAVDFLTSDDGVAWTRCERFDNTWQNSYPQSTNSKAWRNPRQFIDLTPMVRGRTDFHLKMVLRVNPADERFCVEALRVITALTPPAA